MAVIKAQKMPAVSVGLIKKWQVYTKLAAKFRPLQCYAEFHSSMSSTEGHFSLYL